MEPVKVRQLADGRIYTGRQAQSLGLVDSMGTMEDAVNAAAKKAGIQGKPQIKEYGRISFWDALWGANDRMLVQAFLNRFLSGEFSGQTDLLPSRMPQLR